MLRAFRRELFFSASLVFSVCSLGQAAKLATPASSDADLPVPVSTGVLGRQDALALTEILEHLKVVGASPWLGMQGTGKITYAGQETAAYDATLSNLGGDKFRLDAQSDKGLTSIRIDRRVGKIKGSQGPATMIPPNTAMTGIFPFELPRLASFPASGTSLIDHGLTSVDGTALHRITYEIQALGRNPVTKLPETVAIDLYFDPTSHLLVKSVHYSTVTDSRNAKFLFVVTYGDYRKVGASMVPFHYTETMGGQQYWVLQLSDVQLAPAINATYFNF